jgi:hypothetical protein
MKRMIATLALALPLAALCVLPKSASAQPVNRDSNYDRQPATTQQDNRNYNRQLKTSQQNNQTYDRDRQPNSVQRFGNRHQRKWITGHYEKVNHHRRWVPGHYVYS